MKKTFLNWSSGKDAAFALYLLQQDKKFSVEKLFSSINSSNQRISMHGVREELLIRQAESLGIPLKLAQLPGTVGMEAYNEIMGKQTSELVAEGFTHSAFGDIFLSDLKEYREVQLAEVGLQAVFPLWKKDTALLIREFLQAGFKAITVCIDAKVLDESFCGRVIDEDFLADLPKEVDPCGENGEFHTFVYDGPIFRKPIAFKVGERVQKSFEPVKNPKDNCFDSSPKSWSTKFIYCDLLPE